MEPFVNFTALKIDRFRDEDLQKMHVLHLLQSVSENCRTPEQIFVELVLELPYTVSTLKFRYNIKLNTVKM